MHGTVDDFSYGAVTPVAAYIMACLGGALGLRCVVRSVYNERSWKPGWLALGATSIGCGIWTMHFIAMIGFRVEESPIHYDVGLTVLSLAVAVVVVGIGVFAVGYRGVSTATLCAAGDVTGLGVAAMHYLGMAAIQLNGYIQYDITVVALSIVIAIVAATAALWAAVSIRGFLTSLGASLVMGVAVSGMHYTGMAAVGVHLHGTNAGHLSGESPLSILLPMLIGPIIFLLLAGVVVMFDPMLVLGEGEWGRAAGGRKRGPEGPREESHQRASAAAWRADRPDVPLPHPDDGSGSLFDPPARPARSVRQQPQGAAPRVQKW
ncbi:MHYT domain-containing protein [Streptomyces ipomoeae]|uniref:Signaling protein, N-terminal repeat protein n=1 Tax=Streptomyces ipomoeae 91-03 TaxID=698759 RepID=L1KSK2_9ACTN|nr:MHYT domain-containing protein [Streptomyces ipomoeae]EKX63539.1 signaling protein, N-terminal repeat protein [Streptomyces ipomoeae 91-03]MDX2699347.1 MHYT domain-containing protein [Streptomyces ipomoeae]MDX2842574.1 MHYT domain-containing protein [Streptomyces ipomoeae]